MSKRVRASALLRAAVVALTVGIGATTAGIAQAAPVPPAPVEQLSLPDYLGTWHQLAAVPQPFNLVCARDTKARYSLDPAGNVTVRNSCITWTGQSNRIKGTATVVDKKTNAQLHVSFPGVPTQEDLYGPANYVVTALGPEYSWSLVTDPQRRSGFLLSRTPTLSKAQWTSVRSAMTKAGLNDCLFLTSPTAGGIGQIEPLCNR